MRKNSRAARPVNTPVNDWVAIHTKQSAYRTFVIGIRVPKGSVTKALYWDTADPYHCVRLQDAGEHGFIGRNPGDKDIYVVTGDSGNGMTHGTIAGILRTDLILGRGNEWESLYDPSRILLRAAAEFARETLNVAAQYGDYATAGDVDETREITLGTGALVRQGLKKIAVYRDTDGTLHKCSAICPHLGCIVDWNSAEKTWDCPCHCSRFDPLGKVLNGPANTGLAPAE